MHFALYTLLLGVLDQSVRLDCFSKVLFITPPYQLWQLLNCLYWMKSHSCIRSVPWWKQFSPLAVTLQYRCLWCTKVAQSTGTVFVSAIGIRFPLIHCCYNKCNCALIVHTLFQYVCTTPGAHLQHVPGCICVRCQHTTFAVHSCHLLVQDVIYSYPRESHATGETINQSITLMPGVARRAIHNRKQSQSVTKLHFS